MKPNTKLEITITKDWEEDDTLGPPSPPPAHLIYFPETYAGSKSWQQVNTYIPHRQSNNNDIPEKKPYLIRRQFYTFAKTLMKTLFKNNNLLLMANIVNKLWKARLSFITPILPIMKQLIFIIRHNSYKQLITYSVHFIRHHIMNQTQKTVSIHRTVHPIQTFILLLATVSHLLVRFQKIGYKWAAHTIRNMGGLDSVVLALSAIIFAKSIQRTNRII
ncbi:hypothetical protein INT48_008378 [Thamnidium elegans]|uniref:Uncharacterized protein n=1 Tax=Thamnidium elegans TaxID=101142 RepID=A0A8H7SWM3_9FUNG|nr:hypothetical protein INT48_008378 [Thamnidium elegans]